MVIFQLVDIYPLQHISIDILMLFKFEAWKLNQSSC
jgi:hypothetical protein